MFGSGGWLRTRRGLPLATPNRASPDPRDTPRLPACPHTTPPPPTQQPPCAPHLPAPLASCQHVTRTRPTPPAERSVHRNTHARSTAVQHVHVDRRRRRAPAPFQPLHRLDVVTVLEQMRRERMTDPRRAASSSFRVFTRERPGTLVPVIGQQRVSPRASAHSSVRIVAAALRSPSGILDLLAPSNRIRMTTASTSTAPSGSGSSRAADSCDASPPRPPMKRSQFTPSYTHLAIRSPSDPAT